ncbi:hypothetical protein ACEWY4_022597 [Coilia grayii]|uniref:C2H2-type domain-containing protein n=1 Tax=Coilia grayii TaxID=363190 RepID=A0ABD1J7K1_9TELE
MQCRYCKFSHSQQDILLKHYRLHHWQAGKGSFPCIHPDCVCIFTTTGALKTHLWRAHPKVDRPSSACTDHGSFRCELCDFSDICSLAQFLKHLGRHLQNHERVNCPFSNCDFSTTNNTTFRVHKSRKHRNQSLNNLCTSVCSVGSTDNDLDTVSVSQSLSDQADDIQADSHISDSDLEECEPVLEHKLAALFMCMQSQLHVSQSASQQIIDHVNDILSVANSNTLSSIQNILLKHNCNVNESIVADIAATLQKTNPFLSATTDKGPLSTNYKRNIYFKDKFGIIEPVEYVFNRVQNHTFVYVPLLKTLKSLLERPDVLEKTFPVKEGTLGFYTSPFDGQYFKVNKLVNGQDFRLSLGLFIDDFEIANPLGTSRKKHKITAVYWVILNWESQYRSSLHSIQLALLGKSSEVRVYGYESFFEPLLHDLRSLEHEGLYVEQIGENVRGTVLNVSADNLGAHGLAGFQESFCVEKFCRFCLASLKDIQTTEVRQGIFPLRSPEQHNQCVAELKSSEFVTNVHGVKAECVLQKHLSFFHVITGFPPDVLHDLFEGVIPRELALCLQKLISAKYFTFDQLNSIIQSFPYLYSDKVNRPQRIPKTFHLKKTVGGNAHENWALIRLLPLMVGGMVPEDEKAWQLLMDLKDIVELVVSSRLSEESLCYLESKISDHRQLFTDVFPNERFLPKHHYLEHYPNLIRCFGPLADLWTMRFEAKHSYFKRVVHDTRNFKNPLKTLASRHQSMIAFALDSQHFFKAPLHVEKLKVVKMSAVEPRLRTAVKNKYPNLSSLSLATNATLFGTLYMILSPDNIRKLSIPTPSSVEELSAVLREKLQIMGNFVIQYEDPDFNNELCTLHDITELPKEKATLRIHWEVVLSPVVDDAHLSDFTLDTASLTSTQSPSSPHSPLSACRLEQWPSMFPVPSFSYDVELRLKKANEDLQENGTALIVPRDMKMNILEKLAETVYSYKAYPKDSEIEKVASALVEKHPCLKAPGSDTTGCEAWKISLKFKMANYRQKLRNAGCSEMVVNTHSRQGSSRGSLKRPRRSELNFLPDHPVGLDEEELERERSSMEEEVKKRHLSLTILNAMTTFSLRRKEIVQDQPLVSTIKQRWPGLFFEEEVCAEFFRINRIDLKSTFLTSLDNHTQGLLTMYRAKARQGRWNNLYKLLEELDSQTLCFQSDSVIYCVLQNTEALGPHTQAMKIGILEVTDSTNSGPHPTVVNVAVVLEEEVVMDNLGDFTNAFMMLFGLLYALNMEYPKDLRYTFEAVQKIILNLGKECTARIQSLKNKLLQV